MKLGKVVAISGNLASSAKIGQIIVRIDERYFRPTEVDTLLGDPSKAKNLGWEPKISAKKCVKKWFEKIINPLSAPHFLKQHGLEIPFPIEN